MLSELARAVAYMAETLSGSPRLRTSAQKSTSVVEMSTRMKGMKIKRKWRFSVAIFYIYSEDRSIDEAALLGVPGGGLEGGAYLVFMQCTQWL